MSQIRVNTIQNANGVTGITFAANGQVTLANTPLQLTGGQIKFPGTQIASADANTLDDYEEGTWTPNVINDGQTSTWSTKTGTYRKVGSIVFAWWYCDSGVSGASTGNLYVTGLPFSVGNAQYTTIGNWGINYSSSGSDGFNLLSVGGTAYYYKGGANITAIVNYASGCAVYHV